MELIRTEAIYPARPTVPTRPLAGQVPTSSLATAFPAARMRADRLGGAAHLGSGRMQDVMVVAALEGNIQGATDPKFWNRVGPPAGRSPV